MSGIQFVERIDNLLLNRKESRAEFLRHLNLPRNAITNWNNRGNIPAADIAVSIAKYLGTTVEFLVLGESQEAPELTAEQKRLLASWEELSESDKEEIEMLIDFKNKAAKAKAVPADSVG